jgi:hypothetical protein
MRAFLLGVLISVFSLTTTVQADWIHGIFSERAGLDSLERIITLRDEEPNHVFGGRIASLGDITGDGCSDILVCRWENTTMLEQHPCYLFEGGCPPDSQYDGYFTGLKPVFEPIGDMNLDGFVDLGMFHAPSSSYWFLFGGPTFDDIPDYSVPNRFTSPSKVVDLDGDGELDAAVSEDKNGGDVFIYSVGVNRDTIPEYTISDTAAGFGFSVATGDFNGDGWHDLVISAVKGLHPSFIKFYWGGPQFDTIPDLVIAGTSDYFGEVLVPVGDFNGDGFEDIYIGAHGNYPYGIYYGGPDIDDTMDLVVNSDGWGYWGPESIAAGGDYNNDGYPDLIFGDMIPVGFFFSFKVFMGGPTDDTVRFPDIYVENLMVPEPLNYLGAEVASIGDFNGDGIDDFAVRSQTSEGSSEWYGEVHIFAGWEDVTTDVEYDYTPSTPTSYTLHQPYPNPFNPTTTIEFDIKRRTQVRLTIHNILGEEVRVLLDKTVSAGSYSLQWDGRGTHGGIAPSGVYFVRLQTAHHSISRKIVLLK